MSVTHEGVHYPDWEPGWLLDSREPAVCLPTLGQKVRTVAQIYRDGGFGREGHPLFYVPNASLRLDADHGKDYQNGLEGHHPWATDVENDTVHTLSFMIKYLTIKYAARDSIQFRGLLTEARGWNPAMETPFDGKVKQPYRQSDGTDDWYVNSGYPYLPPRIRLPQGGISVDVEFNYGPKLDKWWRKYEPKVGD